ncbi:MAG TPA: hypothetical protein VGS19_01295 [Streptosporangiaceae bacterium]|nr:hypothetical protein [Streptosporangiaceae bacterium]
MTILQTFRLPSLVVGSDAHKALGRELIAAWQADGIFEVQATGQQQAVTDRDCKPPGTSSGSTPHKVASPTSNGLRAR